MSTFTRDDVKQLLAARDELDRLDDLISTQLAEAERHLERLRIGVPVWVPVVGTRPECWVMLDKHAGRWRLLWVDGSERRPLHEMPRDQRATAAAHVPELLGRAVGHLRASTAQRRATADYLEQVLLFLKSAPHEEEPASAPAPAKGSAPADLTGKYTSVSFKDPA